MENSQTRLAFRSYKEAWATLASNKYTWLVPLLFLVPNLVRQVYYDVVSRIIFPQTLLENIYNTTPQTMIERITALVSLGGIRSALNSLTFGLFFSGLGLLIAFFIFYKKLRSSFLKFSIVQTIAKIILGIMIIGAALCAWGIVNKNMPFFDFGISLVNCVIMIFLIMLMTVAEGIFLLFLKTLLLKENRELGFYWESLKDFYPKLFLINLILGIIGMDFLLYVVLAPSYGLIFFKESSQFWNFIPPMFYQVVGYIHSILTVLLIFTPFFLVIQPSMSLVNSVKKNFGLIRKRFSDYLLLLLGGIIGVQFIKLVFELLLQRTREHILIYSLFGVAYSLIFSFFVLLFLIAVFHFVIKTSE